MPTITVVAGDDWEGLYIDRKLVHEGHSIEWWHVLDALGIKYRSEDVDVDWLHERGRFPDRLEEVLIVGGN